MFEKCVKLSEIDVSGFDTSSVTNMSGMFARCSSLTEIDANNFDTSNVTNMRGMFTNCTNLQNIYVSKFDTSNVQNLSDIFCQCDSLVKVDLDNWSTSSLTNADYMFQVAANHAMTEVNLGKNFTITVNEETGEKTPTCKNIFQNHNNSLIIKCNSTTANTLSSMYPGFQNIRAIY